MARLVLTRKRDEPRPTSLPPTPTPQAAPQAASRAGHSAGSEKPRLSLTRRDHSPVVHTPPAAPVLSSNQPPSVVPDTPFGLPEVQVPVAVADVPNFINDSQVSYSPLSQAGPSDALIPSALHAPMTQAFGRLRENVGGDIDGWTAEKLQWTTAELRQNLSCEQIDAVAMAIVSMEAGHGMLVGDVTGFGKGRILASALRYAALSGRTSVFLTEKESLFTDIWRDIRDIRSEDVVGRPFILNDGATIIDMRTRKPVFPRWKPLEVRGVVANKELPEGTRLVLSTYSQFNRRGAKSDFLLSIAPGCSLFTDEVQNIANETSSTSDVVSQAMRLAISSTNASATSGRDVANLRTYGSVFPWLSGIPEIETMSPERRTWLAEISVQEAVRCGRLIRREQDFSTMNLEMLEDTENLPRAIEIQNALAPLLTAMSGLNRMVERVAEERNMENEAALENLRGAAQKEAREKWTVANFGGRQAVVAGQVEVSLLVDFAVEEAVRALMGNEKPIIVLDSTMEAVMQSLSQGGEDGSEEDDAVRCEEGLGDEAARPPGFRDIFRILTEKILTMNVRRGNPLVLTQEKLDPQTVGSMPELLRDIDELIEAFPEIPASPLDAIRDGIERRGAELFAGGEIERAWRVGEISGRKTCIRDGAYTRIPTAELNRPMVVSAFNHDEGVDAILLTRSGSTGLSLHDSETNAVAKRRVMIDVKTPDNPLERLQMYGRPRRRGQRSEPRFACLTTGLPHHTYKLAVHNRKMMSMAASVSGSRLAAPGLDVPDFLNVTGNDVARNMLRESPALARRLHIFMGKDDAEAERELYYVMSLFRRSPQLTYDEQRTVFDDFMAIYTRRANEFGVRSPGRMPGEWHIETAGLVEPGAHDGDGLDGGDVVLATIRRTRKGRALSHADVIRHIDRAAEGWPDVSAYTDYMSEHRIEFLEHRRGRLRGNIEELAADNRTSVARMDREMTFARTILLACRPGRPVRMVDAFGEEAEGILTGLTLPENVTDATIFRDYGISYVLPGDDETRHVTLDQMIRSEGRMTLLPSRMTADMMARYPESPGDGIEERRYVLMGGLMRACLLAEKAGVGTKAQFRDTSGSLHDGIVLTGLESMAVLGSDLRVTSDRLADGLLKAGVTLRSRGDAAEERLMVSMNPAFLNIRFPRGAKERKHWENTPLSQVVDMSGYASERRLPKEALSAVLTALKDAGEALYYSADEREKAWGLEMESRSTGLDYNAPDRPAPEL